MTLTRRDLFKRSAVAGAGLVAIGNLEALLGALPAAASPTSGAGPLVPDPKGLLDLPEGFTYEVLAKAGDPLRGHAGVIPGRPDAMGTFAWGKGTRIVQNHEQGSSGSPATLADEAHTYDAGAVGGTTTLTLDGSKVTDHYVSLAGTVSNCAGGVTPWGTWLTCEETEQVAGGAYSKDHGWVFEVDPDNDDNNQTPTPLRGLGRFPHEAAVVDPDRGHVYLTEDASRPNGLLYRFRPNRKPETYGDLRGDGVLEALFVEDLPDLSVVTDVGTSFIGTWVAVPDPLAAALSTRKQFNYVDYATRTPVPGPGGDVTRSKKFEGMWWADGRAYIVCSYAHGAGDWSEGSHDGQVWSYDPATSTLRLEVRFAPAPTRTTSPTGPTTSRCRPTAGSSSPRTVMERSTFWR